MFANSSPFFGILMCCGTDHMPIVFQGFLYSQTFTFKTPCLYSWELCPCPALPLMWCLQGTGKQAAGCMSWFGRNLPLGCKDYTFWFKMKQWPLIKAQTWARSHQHWRLKISRTYFGGSLPPLPYALLWTISCSGITSLPQKTPTHTAKHIQTNTPFPKPFEISQLKS